MSAARIEIDLPAGVLPWRLTAASPERGETASITGTWTPPDADPPPPREWRHSSREESPLELAGVAGDVVADRFEASGYELRREVWQAHDRGSAAVRQVLVNRGEQPIRLQALLPLRCDGPESLLLAGRGAGEWDVLVQKRFKNDGPTAFRPGVADADLEMAVKPVGPTGEVVPEVGEGTTLVRADPFCMLRSRGDGAAPALLIG
ncbi:MAG: hypothetical protein OXH50_01335, partial [Gemmatimonadetes bacterium]|nr:hypothetical protein [Gemmatimonadota bacterium]